MRRGSVQSIDIDCYLTLSPTSFPFYFKDSFPIMKFSPAIKISDSVPLFSLSDSMQALQGHPLSSRLSTSARPIAIFFSNRFHLQQPHVPVISEEEPDSEGEIDDDDVFVVLQQHTFLSPQATLLNLTYSESAPLLTVSSIRKFCRCKLSIVHRMMWLPFFRKVQEKEDY